MAMEHVETSLRMSASGSDEALAVPESLRGAGGVERDVGAGPWPVRQRWW